MPQFVTTPSGVTTPIDYDFAVSFGLVTGHAHQRGVGVAPSVATSTPTDIWAGSTVSALYPFLTTAQSLEIISDSTHDTFTGGTGAISIIMNLLDANFNLVTQTVLMNGTTAVAIPGGPYLRCNSLQVNSAGSTLSNVGNITLRIAGAGAIVQYIAATVGISQTSIFTVPTGYTLALNFAYANLQSTSTATNWANIGFYIQQMGVTSSLYQRFQTIVTGTGQVTIPIPSPATVVGGQDLIFRVTNTSGTLAVAAQWQGILVNNNVLK
jgi:hypothetical protein